MENENKTLIQKIGTEVERETLKIKKQNHKNKKQEVTQNRVIITKEANQELENTIEKIKEGNLMVEVTKSDIANYIFNNLSKILTDSDFKSLRNIHFNEKRVLQGLLKQTQDGFELPQEIKKMVRDYYGLNEQERKRSSKNSSRAVLET